jgi:hypothetical protein
MRTKMIFCMLAALAASMPAMRAQSRGPGFSPLNPAQVGTRLETVIECGFGYSPHEKYDVKVTLLEVLRRDKASERIKAASASNQPPKAGSVCLARVKLGVFAKAELCHELRQEEFAAFRRWARIGGRHDCLSRGSEPSFQAIPSKAGSPSRHRKAGTRHCWEVCQCRSAVEQGGSVVSVY